MPDAFTTITFVCRVAVRRFKKKRTRAVLPYHEREWYSRSCTRYGYRTDGSNFTEFMRVRYTTNAESNTYKSIHFNGLRSEFNVYRTLINSADSGCYV